MGVEKSNGKNQVLLFNTIDKTIFSQKGWTRLNFIIKFYDYLGSCVV